MRYLLLMYEAESTWAALGAEDRRAHIDGYDSVRKEAERCGHLIAADGLGPTARAKTVRRRNGNALVTDGPFAETKEQLGGFYLLECTEDEALAYARALPGIETGSVEVRPVGVPH